MEIKKGMRFRCIKDVVMDDETVGYRKGGIYISEKAGCITDEEEDINHLWYETSDNYDTYFELLKDEPENPEPSVKNDFKDGKLRWDLLPLELIEEVVRVYDAGAKKYGANRWQNLEDGKNRYFGAMMRHIRASQIEDIDEDTGCYHLAQVCFNALAMLHFKLKEKE